MVTLRCNDCTVRLASSDQWRHALPAGRKSLLLPLRVISLSAERNLLRAGNADALCPAHGLHLRLLANDLHFIPSRPLRSFSERDFLRPGKVYNACAVVGSSGSLLHFDLGREIDEHEGVFRTDMAGVRVRGGSESRRKKRGQ